MANNGIDLSAFKWLKSSYSNGDGGDCVEIGVARWRKSSHSNGSGGSCVEVDVGAADNVVPVRDTKTAPHGGPVLVFQAQAWTRFIASLTH